jgi:hypothetical protein
VAYTSICGRRVSIAFRLRRSAGRLLYNRQGILAGIGSSIARMKLKRKTSIIIAMLMLPVVVFAADAGDFSREWGVVLSPCEWCAIDKRIEIHHAYPQHLYPWLRQVDRYKVCLCRTCGTGCHFYVGHGGISWRNEALYVQERIIIKWRHINGPPIR